MSAPAASRRIAGWELHGVRMRFQSNSDEAIRYVRAHLAASDSAPDAPDMDVTLNWHWGRHPAVRPSAPGERIGKDLVEKDGRILWSRVPGFEGLAMEAGPGDSGLTLTSTCGYAPRDAFAKMRYLRSGRRDRKTHKTFFKLLYYTAYYPMIWHLARTRGWGLLHASAVELAGRAVILAGHGGVGKSTLSLSLMADPSFRFISDNLLLHDETSVYSLPEPVRLDASSLRAIRAAGFEPSHSEVPLTAHSKPTYWVAGARASRGAEAGVVILLRFTPRPLLRPLSPAEVKAHLAAARDLAREVEGYRTVSAFLSMSIPDDSDNPVPHAPLASLATRMQGYVLGIGDGEPVPTTLARIREVCG